MEPTLGEARPSTDRPTPTAHAESPFEEWCPFCGVSAVVRLAPGWDDGRAIPIVGCGNPWHYATRSLGDVPEAEARDATGLLREALERHVTGEGAMATDPDGDCFFCEAEGVDHEAPFHPGADPEDVGTHEDWCLVPIARAALAATPPEPRWPSVEALALAINAVSPFSDDPQDPMTENERAMIGMAREEFARRILGALREGGERP